MLKSVCHNIVFVKGVGQMLTKDDEGGRGGKPKGDEGWQGEGVWKPPKLADIICEQPLRLICQSITNLLIQCKSWFNLPIQYKYKTHPPIHCQSANSKQVHCQSVNLKSIHPQSAYSKPLSQTNSNQPILDQNANPISIPKQSTILS